MSPAAAKKRPGPAPRYTREEVIAAALEVIDEGPADSFSMRRLGDRLGVNPMTLYGYVEDKDDLIEAATLLAVERIHEEPAPDAPWHEQVRLATRDLYRASTAHPNLTRMVVGGGVTGHGLFRTRERILQLFLAGGAAEEDAVRATGILAHYVLGFGIGHAGPEERTDLTEADFEIGLAHLIDGLTGPLRRGER